MSMPPEVRANSSGAAGVIHDIGYRRYSGPRLGRGHARRSLFVYSLRTLFGLGRRARSKVLPFGLAGVLLVPALISVAVTAALGFDAMALGRYLFAMQAVVALFLATQTPVLVTGDFRHTVLGLYFSRPLQRGDYVAAKMGALFTGTVILLVAPLLLLYLGEMLAGRDPLQRTAAFLPAFGGAVVLAAVLTSVALALTVFTRRRAFGIASIIAYFLISGGVVGILRQLATQTGNETLADYVGLFAPFPLVDGFQGWALGVNETIYPPPGGTVAVAYAAATVAMIVGPAAIVWWRYRKVRV